jgi:hypothetical protein
MRRELLPEAPRSRSSPVAAMGGRMSDWIIDGQRQPKPKPMNVIDLLDDKPIVIYDDPEGWHAYEAWLDTVPDRLPGINME